MIEPWEIKTWARQYRSTGTTGWEWRQTNGDHHGSGAETEHAAVTGAARSFLRANQWAKAVVTPLGGGRYRIEAQYHAHQNPKEAQQ